MLAVIAGIAIGSLLPGSRSGNAEIEARGFGVQVQNVNTATLARTARQAAGVKGVPEVSEAMLRESMLAVIENARRGDANATALLFELAAVQKAKAAELAKNSAATRAATGNE
jgi:hypothetical protein